MSKQYGLIVPNKDKLHKITEPLLKKPSIFEEDSDSDSATAAKPTGIKKSVKKQDKLNQIKAVEEDPTVYQYDEIYDEMDQKRKETKLAKKDLDKKPKYINRLLAAADRRKRENERRIERQVQKEREAEGEQYKDKDSFVTSSYKKKLEEMKELEEQEKREEYLESIGDVKKQGNLDGFYRHLYDQKVNYEDKTEEKPKTSEDVSVKEEQKSSNEKNEDSPKRKSLSRSGSEDDLEKDKKKSLRPVKKRKYRKREDSSDSEDDKDDPQKNAEIKKEHLPSNLDADSDFSIDSSDSEDENNPKKKEEISKVEDNKEITNVEKLNNENMVDKPSDKDVKEEEVEKKEEVIEEPKPKKPKIDIWKKRTVGDVFDEALKRYFERKALRSEG